jgi:HK97 family phage major capsid protein
MTIQELQDQHQELYGESQSILALVDAEKRVPTDEENERIQSLIQDMNEVKANKERLEAIHAHGEFLSSSAGRKAVVEDPRAIESDDADDAPAAVRPTMGGRKREPSIEVRPPGPRGRWGWRTFGEFANSVRHANSGGQWDGRLSSQMAASTYGSEGTGVDGGFAVPPDFRSQILQKVMGEDQLISMTDQQTTSTNNITMPVDTTTPWQSTGGIQAYWDGEAQVLNASKPALEQVQLKLNKLTCLVPVSEELMDDAPSLEMYLRRKAIEKMQAKVNTAIVTGTGVGQPLGILNSPALVTVADEMGSYITPTDIFKMWSRMYGPLRSSAVWLINQSVEPELFNMHVRVPNQAANDFVGGGPVYLPANGVAGSPYSTLMGRPVIPSQACKALNTPGDILFVNLGQYLTVTKGGGIQQDSSIHLYFDQQVTAFRFIFRLAGRSWWDSTVSPENGSDTLSWAVALDTRT